jgi:hypothetical protein
MRKLATLIRTSGKGGPPEEGRYHQNNPAFHFDSGHSRNQNLDMFDSPYEDITSMLSKIPNSAVIKPYYDSLKEFSSAYYRELYKQFCRKIKSDTGDFTKISVAFEKGDEFLRQVIETVVGNTERKKYLDFINEYLVRTNFDSKFDIAYNKLVKNVYSLGKRTEKGGIGPITSLYTYLQSNKTIIINKLHANLFTVDILLRNISSDLSKFKAMTGLEAR